MQQRKLTMPSIAYVVARSYPGNVIGCDNKLPWKLKTDLRLFRRLTDGHVVLMGRKTLDSIGHPLKNRVNVVLSRNAGSDTSDLKWAQFPEQALFLSDFWTIMLGHKRFFVIGGEDIYNRYIGLFNHIVLTTVFGEFPQGDAFFDFDIDRRQWQCIEESPDYPKSEEDEYGFRVTVWERKLKYTRQRDISEFMTGEKVPLPIARFTRQCDLFENTHEEQIKLPLVA
jgi:dihydrofolate reductase